MPETVARVGGLDRVTGAQRFTADVAIEDVLQAALVTIDAGHARIARIDVDQALAMEGVVRVLTSADFGEARFGPRFPDRPIIASTETVFHGDPVAVVVAVDKETAEEAAAAVVVEYEEIPGVYDIETALHPESPLVVDPALRDDDPLRDTNVRQRWDWGWGDVDEAPADLVVEETYDFPMVTHFSIEPHVFAAAPDGGGLEVWSTIQHPYILQRTLASMFDLPTAKVRVHAPDIGGGFGGKGYPKYEPLVAATALAVGKPVKLVLSLEQTFQAVRRTNTRMRIRCGFTSDGRLTFIDSVNDFMMGAYTDIAPRVISKASYFAAGPYKVPALRAVVRGLMSHTTPSTAFRGFGAPQMTWAIEAQMDAAARALGIDGVQMRLANLAGRGEEIIPGDKPADGDWAEAVRIAAAQVGWEDPLPKGHGRGLAVGIKSSATAGASYCILRLLYDGSVSLVAGTSDMGQGARTILSQLVSVNLGVPLDRVSLLMGDTAVVPFDYSTSASRSTVFMGNAVVDGCRKMGDEVVRRLAERRDVDPGELKFGPDGVEGADGVITLSAAVREIFGPVPGELIVVGEERGEGDPYHPLGGPASFYEFSCTASEVSVDLETGEFELVKHVTVADVGKAINRQHVEMQDEGAAVMGLGHTLMEHIVLDERGRIVNLGALDYRIPTFKDLPEVMTSILVENEDGPGPGGAKGTGEGGLLATAPAIAAALTSASGVVIRDLPLTPERVWRALHGREHGISKTSGS